MSSWSEAVWIVQQLKKVVNLSTQLTIYADRINELNNNVNQLETNYNSLQNQLNRYLTGGSDSETFAQIATYLYGEEDPETHERVGGGIVDRQEALEQNFESQQKAFIASVVPNSDNPPVEITGYGKDSIWFVIS